MVKTESQKVLGANSCVCRGYRGKTGRRRGLFPLDESKDILKKYEEIWSKSRDLTRSIANNSDDYDQKCMKIKFNSG